MPADPVSNVPFAELESAVIRIYERYAVEVVERFDLCPWAERARRFGRVRPHVLFESDPTAFGSSLEAIIQLAADDRVEVGLLLYPRLRLGRRDFDAIDSTMPSPRPTRISRSASLALRKLSFSTSPAHTIWTPLRRLATQPSPA